MIVKLYNTHRHIARLNDHNLILNDIERVTKKSYSLLVLGTAGHTTDQARSMRTIKMCPKLLLLNKY